MFSRISIIFCAIYLIIFAVNQIFGAGVGDWNEWISGVAFGIATCKILDLIPENKGGGKNA